MCELYKLLLHIIFAYSYFRVCGNSADVITIKHVIEVEILRGSLAKFAKIKPSRK